MCRVLLQACSAVCNFRELSLKRHPKYPSPDILPQPGLSCPWSWSKSESKNESGEAGMMDVFYTWACSNLVFCADCTQLFEQVWELHRQSVFILTLDFSCQCCLCEPPWVWRQYTDFCVGKALMRGAMSPDHYPDLSTVWTQLHCFSTWAGLSAQHRALPCRLMNSGIPTPPQGSWSRLFAVQKNWKVCGKSAGGLSCQVSFCCS